MKKPYLPEKDHAAIPQFIEGVRRDPPDWTLLESCNWPPPHEPAALTFRGLE